MAHQSGTRALNAGMFRCAHCEAEVRLKKGERIPRCPCGSREFEKHLA